MSRMSKTRVQSNPDRLLSGSLLSFAKSTMTELKTHQSLLLGEMLSTSRFGDAILAEGVNPRHYSNSDDFKKDYLATELLSKYPMDIGVDREAVAIQSFVKAESDCKDTNRRFAPNMVRNWPFWERSVMETARLNIANLLRTFNWDEAEPGFSFGPGATSSLSRRNASTENKLRFGSDTTPGALHAYEAVMGFFQGWKSALEEYHTVGPRVVKGSRIVTVPKNAKTDRIIAIEPDLNMFLQKGLGRLIRNRLRDGGLNLNRAWEANHELAQAGSRYNSFATLDLKAASDSVAYKLVEFLLPDDWFEALSLTRCRQALLPSGDWVTLQKFSSMGNGYTFELESLIFWALAKAVASIQRAAGPISVFGDDIIVPTDCDVAMRQILAHCGFTVNEKKSFSDGPFRESCGKHYFMGWDVTPFYLRNDRSSVLTLISALNRSREWSRHPVWGLDGLRETYLSHTAHLPAYWRHPRIPYGYGDGALWGEFDEVRPRKAPHGKEGWICDAILPVTKAVRGTNRFSVLSSLMKMEGTVLDEFTFRKPLANFAGKYKKGRIHVTQWPSFGGWMRWPSDLDVNRDVPGYLL